MARWWDRWSLGERLPNTVPPEETLLPGEQCLHSCWRSTILDSIADGVFTIDAQWRITSWNHAAERITGYGRAEVLGQHCFDVFKASICNGQCALNRTVETGTQTVGLRVEIVAKDGHPIPISVSTAVLRGTDGRVVGGVESFRDVTDLEALRREVNERRALDAIVGAHPRMRAVLDLVPVLAASEATVLITGPSGSGKSLVAATIHRLSPRSPQPFVVVSCAALPEHLLESELFGHVKGAFTDARRDRAGRIALADRGTIFLDEVGDLPAAIQMKLLRFLQDREYEPVGSDRTVHADVRVIAATNAELLRLVESGRFREDLYYRLAVVELAMPALREHRDDIPALAAQFVARQASRTGKDIRGVADEAIEALLRHDWPGNVRELENAIEHAFVLCPGGMIATAHLPRAVVETSARLVDPSSPIERAEAETIREVLRRCGGNRARAARELGLHRSTLWRKLQRLGE